ncbi:DNA polymerase epsilon catalytic subunit, partial [Coemansia sp. IMI 209127]
RRGELKLIKIFQSQIFKVFLQGSTLEECYGSVAKVADQWLDILFSRAQGLPDDELFDLITENRSMSKALESYGGMKSTSICTARRLAEFLGDQMVKDKGLACKFVISRLPRDQPVSERAVPVAIFSADAATKRQFLRRWLRDNSLDNVDIRDILDWDYYLERFGSVIQKLITIPAAMQGVANPVPRIRHPDWLSKRVSAAMNKHKQRHITDLFKKVSKQEYLDKAAEEDAKMREEASALGGDIEDLGISGSTSAVPRPKTGVVRKSKSKHQQDGFPRTVEGLVARLSELGSAPSPSDGYVSWLVHSKKIWALSRRLRVARQKAVENGDEAPDSNWRPSTTGPADGIGQYFARSSTTLSRGVWNILQWSETDTPGELKAWVLLGSQLHAVRVSVPRVLYVTSTVPRQEISDSRYFTEARSMVLPRTSYTPHSMHLYKSVMTEAEYIAYQSSWSSFFAHPSIGGVYETEVTPLDRALIQLGATAWMSSAARQMYAGRTGGLGDVVSLDELDTRRSSLTVPHGLGKQLWKARDLSYALLYHAGSSDGRQFFALIMPYAARGHVWVVNTNQQTAQLQIPNLERLYRESHAAARAAESAGDAFEDGAFVYPEAIEFTSQAFATAQGAYRSINAAVAKCADEKRGSTVLIYHSSQPAKRLRSFIRSISELPTISVPVHHADTVLPAIDWQRHACRRMVASLLNCSQWVDERISLSQYADVPVGNIPADAPMFLADMFFARKLSLAKHILWWSPSSKPDLGGRQDDEFNELESDGNESTSGFATSIEVNVPGSYSSACVEIELKGLVINTILKAPLVNEIEGALGVFGFDSMAGGSNDTAALLGDDDVAGSAAAERIAATDSDSGRMKKKNNKNNKDKGRDAEAEVGASGNAGKPNALQMWAASGADGNVPVSTFQLLRSLLRGWCQEMDEHGNPFAEMMAEHFYRWLTRPNARLFDPALAYLVRSLMRKVFLQMKAELQKLGARIVYANIDKLIVTTGKASVASAQAAIAYITKAIVEKPLFESMTLVPLQYWTFLLWMNASNYGGIVVQQQQQQQQGDSADQTEAVAAGEPRIEMLWNMKEYLPVVVQSHFELAVAEFIYKLAGFHAQLHAKNPHAAHGAGSANGQSDIIEDSLSDSEQADSALSQKSNGKNKKKGPAAASDSVMATKGAFYKRLIGQYFTRKLLDTVGQIRDACSSAHRNDPDTMFPRLPGSKLHLRGARTEAALEFVKYVSTVFALDVPATNFVRIMRRNLLALLSIGEFSEDAQFSNPCERLVLPRVVCDFCNFCRDMDFCRDADLLPAPAVAGEDGSHQASPPEWQCLGCGSAYDRVRIEERLIEQLRALVLSYQMQDLVCSKCRLMKQDNFSLQCASCAGKYKPAVSADSIRTQIDVYRDVAQMSNLAMLLDLASWAHDNARSSVS